MNQKATSELKKLTPPPREKPILFSTEMARAILDGKKTQTRRVIDPQPTYDIYGYHWSSISGKYAIGNYQDIVEFKKVLSKYSPYQKGDLLWVRESFALPEPADESTLVYLATANLIDKKLMLWKPSIFMPKKYARIWLRIKDVYPEKLQNISEADAKAEGVLASDTVQMNNGSPCYTIPFYELWKSIHGIDNPKSWESNPWVWVIKFERVK
jgi:hypothetical protein